MSIPRHSLFGSSVVREDVLRDTVEVAVSASLSKVLAWWLANTYETWWDNGKLEHEELVESPFSDT
jgi:hypothetical protein